jgi:hypothetical protein
MEWSRGRIALGAAVCRMLRPGVAVVAFACAMVLAGCNVDGQASMSAAQPRGASVAFESIDGPPPGQFQKLVQNLNDEAQSRRLAVISRDSPSVYRVRGYLAAKVVKGQSTISWVWDVFDRDEHRALRISGEEIAKGHHRDAWSAADDAMLQRIAHASMDQLASFLTSSDGAPNAPAPADEVPVAFVGPQDSTPESAGIFRIFQANADPMPGETADAATSDAASVPLPRRRPTEAVSAGETLTLAAASHGLSR